MLYDVIAIAIFALLISSFVFIFIYVGRRNKDPFYEENMEAVRKTGLNYRQVEYYSDIIDHIVLETEPWRGNVDYNLGKYINAIDKMGDFAVYAKYKLGNLGLAYVDNILTNMHDGLFVGLFNKEFKKEFRLSKSAKIHYRQVIYNRMKDYEKRQEFLKSKQV